jgi:hypothetical protein
MADEPSMRVEQGTHKFTLEALQHGKPVLRCERRLCLVIWYEGKPKPSTTCWGKDS